MAPKESTHKRSSSNTHSRKKSNGTNTSATTTSTTDLVRTKRTAPSALARRSPATLGRLGRRREPQYTEEITTDDDDETESFPQYCMSCEKEFVPFDNTNLYCSDVCRSEDESASRSFSTSPPDYNPYSQSRPRVFSTDTSEPRDIVPRARPSSMLSDGSPLPRPELAPIVTDSSAMAAAASAAAAALRSFTHPSPPSPTGSSSSIWPWRSSGSSGLAIIEPTSAKSYTLRRSGGWFSSPSTSAVAAVDAPGHYYDLYTTMARPMAPQKAGASTRPKSIELIQPLAMGRWD